MRFKVRIWEDTGIPQALRKYCEDHKMSPKEVANAAIAEKISRMDIHSMSIAEIEEVEGSIGRIYNGISGDNGCGNS